MLQDATIGMCVLSQKDLVIQALRAADSMARDVLSGLALLDNPMRLVASLRQ